MTNAEKITMIDSRIKLLKTRGETMNMNLIKKLERKKRALLAQ
jgi:hypothetical protein